MKRIIVLVLVLVGCVKFSDAQIETYPEKYGFKVWTGQMVPDFEVKMTNGKTVKMKKLRGKVVLLDFVGVHCGPCIAGLKKFEKGIFERFKGKDLVVIPILVKYKNLEEVKKFQERLGFTFPFGLDEDFAFERRRFCMYWAGVVFVYCLKFWINKLTLIFFEAAYFSILICLL